MKKYFFSLLAAVATLFAVSCSQDDELVSAAGNGEQNVTFSVQLPGAAQTRAIADGVEVGGGDMANTLICALYEQGKTSETPLILKQIEERSNGIFELQLPMAKDLTYEILFLAYNEDNCAFNVNFTEGDLTSVNLQALTLKSDLKANQEAYDVFVGRATHKVNDEAVTLVKLNRPFGQVNAATTLGDLQNAETLKAVVTTSALELTGVPTTYNVFTGEVSGSATLTYKAADILKAVPATTPVNEKISVEGNDYYYLAMAYVLAGNGTNDKSLHDATFKFNRADGTTVSTVKVANMPIQRNYRTNVVGELLTHAEGFKVVVDEVFKEPAEGVSYWDGKTMKEPAVENGAYVIRSAAEYAWLFNHANPITRAASSLTGTIEIAADLNMGGYEISGITAASSGELTINGNGHTISNAVVVSGGNDNGTETSGLFVSLSNSELTVKDLDIKNVNVIAGDTYEVRDFTPCAGVICGYVEGSLSVENVNVSASKAHGLHSIGGLMGFIAAYGNVSVKNCTVDGVTLTVSDVDGESGAMGGLVGRVAGVLTVNNATVSNTTIDAYVGTASDQKRSIAKYIGNLVGGATVEVVGGVIENVTINAKNDLAASQSCLYSDFLGGWRGNGGTVTINGVSIEKEGTSIVTTAEELAAALSAAQNDDVIGIGASIKTNSLNASGKNVTLLGMTANAGIDATTSGWKFSSWTGNITAKNLTIKTHSTGLYYDAGIDGHGTFAFEKCNFEGISTAMNGNFTYDECTFVNTVKGSYAAWVYSGTATYNKCTFTGVDRAVKVYTEAGVSATATYNNCTFNSTEVKKAAVEIDASNNNGRDAYYTVNINNATVNGMAKGEFTGNVYCNIEGTNAKVYVDGKAISQAIRIGNKAYATLGEAINAAQADDEIVLADGTYEGCFKVGKDLTISAMNEGQAIINGMMYAESEKTLKLNGLTLTNEIAQTTPNGNAGYNGSVLVLYQANVIADRCTFNVANSGTYAFANKSSDENNYSTFTNCTFNCNGERAIHSKTNIKVDNCTFNDPRSYCIQLRGQGDGHTTRTEVIFTNNKIFDACKTSGKPFAVGLEISANQQFGYVDIQVADNTIDEGTLYYTYVNENLVDWTTCNITGAEFVKEADVVTE